MTNKFIGFLETIGTDFEKGVEKLEPAIAEGAGIASAAEAPLTALDPALGTIFTATVNEIVTVEQKFAAAGQQSGTGSQKLASVVTTIGPVISQAFEAAGKASDEATVAKYVSALVDFLNAIPASNPPAASSPAAGSTASAS